MLEICPKCTSKAVYFDEEPGYQRNVCLVCGFSHCPRGYCQSMERQVTGQNGRFGIGLSFFDYEESTKIDDPDYTTNCVQAVYQLKKESNKREKKGTIQAGRVINGRIMKLKPKE